MIAGKTHSEILVMTCESRRHWYKTISPDEKEEAMRIVYVDWTAKLSARMMGKNNHMYGKMSGDNNPMRRPEVIAKFIGDNNPAHRPDVKTKSSARMKANNPMKHPEVIAKHKESVNRPEYRAMHNGENHHNWQGGKSFEPYGMEFNDELKRQIRARDNHTCQECHRTEEQLYCALDVHHIDYDKRNNSPENLIALCRSCHSQTNFSRDDWTEYFGKIVEEGGGG